MDEEKRDDPGNGAVEGQRPSRKYRVRTEDPAVRWFVVHTLAGRERKVKAAIERSVQERNLQRDVLEVLVPAEEVTTQTKKGKSSRTRVFFPGYVLIQMKLTEETWALVRQTSGVTGFVSAGSTPVPLSDDEVQVILDQLEGRRPRVEVPVNFEAGDFVRIVAGPFANFTGVVEEIYADRGKCKVMITVFGRATAVELDVAEVDKAH